MIASIDARPAAAYSVPVAANPISSIRLPEASRPSGRPLETIIRIRNGASADGRKIAQDALARFIAFRRCPVFSCYLSVDTARLLPVSITTAARGPTLRTPKAADAANLAQALLVPGHAITRRGPQPQMRLAKRATIAVHVRFR
jgi:hypothetical protein